MSAKLRVGAREIPRSRRLSPPDLVEIERSAAREREPQEGLVSCLPISMFSSVMGLSGLALAWRLARDWFGAPAFVTAAIGALAVASFLSLFVAYALKAMTAPATVRSEYEHPIAGNLFGTFFISLLLLPAVIAPYVPTLARRMWYVGAIGMAAFAWSRLDRWMEVRQRGEHATPAWLVPMVGLLDIPIAAPSLGMPAVKGLMPFAFAIGLFFAIPLFVMIFARLLFEGPLPDAGKPSLLILIAPFAVGFSAYVATFGRVDAFAEALLCLTLFLLPVLGARLRHLARAPSFRLSWWAVSFPLAASASAALKFAMHRPSGFANGMAVVLLTLASVVIGALCVRTALALVRGEMRALSG